MNRSDLSCTPIIEKAVANAAVPTPLRATGCPSLRRIVQAKDGGICRIKLPCGQLTGFQAQAISDIAMRYAGNVIEITNRSNLQLRGVRAEHVGELTEALISAGLGSADDGSDEVRNVMVSPMAGVDPQRLVDTTPLASQLLSLLQTEKRFHELSAKFAVMIDGGEGMAMLQHPHDVWLSAMQLESQTLFGFGFAGTPPVEGTDTPALAAVAPQHALALIAAVLHQFLDLASVEQTRMRHLLQQMTADEILRTLRQRVDFPLLDGTQIHQWRRMPATRHAHIGIVDQCDGQHVAVGVVPALGRLDGLQLRNIASVAAIHGDATLRLTPWQSVLLPNISAGDAINVQLQLQALGLYTSNNEPLAHLIACSGSAGCAKGLADTKKDATQLSQHLTGCSTSALDVHLTGCSRSCAAAHVAPYTLLAAKPSRYDLYRRLAGAKEFGTCIASDISIEEAASYLRQFSVLENSQ